MRSDKLASAIALGICLMIAGMGIGYGFYKGRAGDRYVNVKGLAEREVKADLAIWPITFNVAADDLGTLQGQIDSGRSTITGFLVAAGFGEDEISLSAPNINDHEAERRHGKDRAPFRYTGEVTVTTRTPSVDLVRRSIEESGALVGQGIVLAAASWRNPIEFLFTGLNEVKPDMIEEATKDARRAAAKFAKDSESKVGKIRHASQGYFSISDRDRNSPEIKKIRVVTSVQYYLVD
jgi:hypothetical protein